MLKSNSNGNKDVTNKLDEAIIARVVRIIALQWNMYGMVCMRVELYGCDTERGKAKSVNLKHYEQENHIPLLIDSVLGPQKPTDIYIDI